ncbi:MAG TPA: CheR family methyltransferase, partial [Usitatibacter sp.]|nr:CheR family methyltransferase [Usitatibacter sp.]
MAQEDVNLQHGGTDSRIEMHEQRPRDFLVVGIGASAGGIPALSEFFRNVPADSGMAYVVILHLSPDYDSQLAAVLQGVARIPVTQVTERVRVEPDHVYVISPDRHLSMVKDEIEVADNTRVEERRAPVDIFFRTLGESLGPRAVCVVLSGTGANGSMGLKRVKEMGGAAFVQRPREAAFDEMPRRSIATGLVDDILDAAHIPDAVLRYRDHRMRLRIDEEIEERPPDQEALREIFTLVRVRTGHDFSNYKRPTLLRRIERRMGVRNCLDLAAYVRFLHDSPDETESLLRDLLISVTGFFRDAKAWETVEAEVIPKILRTKQAGDSMRMWVAGCATGEEAYTLAMLCAEAVFGHMEVPQVQIFATDIDEEAIAHAREAFYTLNDAADLPPERLARFFVQEQGGYRLRREVREMVMFATHNLVKDPPFSHLDLVACRNLLIYLNRSAQERALATFHFALNPGGYLFLGSSESVDGRADLFAALGTDQHIFRARPASGRSYPVPELATSYTLAPLRLQSGGASGEVRQRERITFAELHQQLLEAYAPPSVVVDEEFDIVHLSPQAGRYLRLAGGEPTMNLLKVAREEIRLELRSALYHAQQTRSPVTAHDLPVHGDEGEEHIDIRVRPVLHPDDPARGFMLVLFAPSAAPLPPQPRPALPAPPITRQLEDEVGRLKAELRTSAQHHELQADKLKASNEELQAINEELRSSAEELETSKEELQSMNEELTTVNQELKIKIDELAHTSNDLQNLIKSTNIATLFLDRTFHVKLFTPTARELFNLIPADVGRPLSDITTRLLDTDLPEHVEAVLRDLQAIEREVRTTGGGVYMMRVLPYRINEDLIAGVVVTFIDITQRKQAEERLRASEADFRASFEVSSVGEAICDGADAHIVRANPALCAMAGYECDELQDRPITALA